MAATPHSFPSAELWPSDTLFPDRAVDIYGGKAVIRTGRQRIVHRASTFKREIKAPSMRLVRR